MSQEILAPNETELQWIEANLRIARSAIKAFAPQHAAEITLGALDAAFTSWLAQHDPQQQDPNPYINAFGIGFGQYLVDHLNLRWAVVKDDKGAEMAVHGQPGDILIFPPSFVAKRYMSKATGFFEPIYAQMEKDIAAARGTTAKRPFWKFWSKDR